VPGSAPQVDFLVVTSDGQVHIVWEDTPPDLDGYQFLPDCVFVPDIGLYAVGTHSGTYRLLTIISYGTPAKTRAVNRTRLIMLTRLH